MHGEIIDDRSAIIGTLRRRQVFHFKHCRNTGRFAKPRQRPTNGDRRHRLSHSIPKGCAVPICATGPSRSGQRVGCSCGPTDPGRRRSAGAHKPEAHPDLPRDGMGVVTEKIGQSEDLWEFLMKISMLRRQRYRTARTCWPLACGKASTRKPTFLHLRPSAQACGTAMTLK